jgi:hypothetical protein
VYTCHHTRAKAGIRQQLSHLVTRLSYIHHHHHNVDNEHLRSFSRFHSCSAACPPPPLLITTLEEGGAGV